jgi:effector-binding domain-containing protein
MARIETAKEIKIEKLLAFRKKMTQSDISMEIGLIGKFLEEKNIKKAGPFITTTFSVEGSGAEQIMDMEFLVPVDKIFETQDRYRFKPLFRVANSVYVRHEGNPNGIMGVYSELSRFMQENSLQPITTGYNVTVKEMLPGSNPEECIIDVYIGTSPNVL